MSKKPRPLKESQILFHDNHLLALNKPANLLTQPSGTRDQNMEDRAKEWIREQKKKDGAIYLHAVHRIDKPVSGVTLFAVSSKALTRLNESMRQKQCKKIYHALVERAPVKEEGTLEHFLKHGDHVAERVKPGVGGGKLSVLNYKVLGKSSGMYLLEIELITGRYHQIRCQLGSINCPIMGDKAYGSRRHWHIGIALHAYELTVPHPTLKKDITFIAPHPQHWPT